MLSSIQNCFVHHKGLACVLLCTLVDTAGHAQPFDDEEDDETTLGDIAQVPNMTLHHINRGIIRPLLHVGPTSSSDRIDGV